MKLSLFPLLALGSLLTSLAALPVEMQNLAVRDEFEVKREEQAELDFLEKRESKALTGFLSSLNRTGAGVFFVRNAANSPGINTAIIKKIGGFFEDDEIEHLLRLSDEAGLALDLVLMFLTHWELYDGLTDMVHYYRGTKPSETGSLLVAVGRLIFNNVFGGIFGKSSLGSMFSLLGGSSGNASVSGLSGFSGLLQSGSSSESTSKNSSGSLDDLFSLVSPSSSESSVESAPINSDGFAPIKSADSAPIDFISSSSAAPVTSGVVNPAPVESAAPLISAPVESPIDDIDDFEDDTLDSRSLPEQFAEVAADVAAFVKRSIKDPEAANEEAQPLARRVNRILKRMDEEDEDSAVAALGDYNDAWEETTRVMEEDDLDSLGLVISLQKSGLGLSIVHDALTDSRWHRFNKRLIEYLLEKELLILQKLLRDLVNSGVIWSVLGDILGSGEYIKIVLNFVRGLFSGDINILGLLRAILT